MENSLNIRGFVLAGGKSSRMGQNKALLCLEKKPLVLRAAEILQPFVEGVTVLGQPDLYGKLWPSVVADMWPDQGPFAAVCTGLNFSHAEWNIFIASDLPLLSRRFIELLIRRIRMTECDAVVPYLGNKWHTLSAAYHAHCKPAFSIGIEDGQRSIIRMLPKIRVDVITRNDLVGAGLRGVEFANMNTPEDWEKIKVLATETDSTC